MNLMSFPLSCDNRDCARAASTSTWGRNIFIQQLPKDFPILFTMKKVPEWFDVHPAIGCEEIGSVDGAGGGV